MVTSSSKEEHLSEVSKNVPELPGVYYVIRLAKGRINNKQDGMKWQDFFDKKMMEENIDGLDIYWFVTMDITNPINSRVNSQNIAELKAEGKKAHLTRKNEIENYISIAVLGLPPGTITITDLSDAKKDIARAMKVRDTEVTERYWPLMTIE